MEISKATVGVVAASCITVGAAGAFLTSRPRPLLIAQTAPAADAASTAGVEQSEAVVVGRACRAGGRLRPAQAALLAPRVCGLRHARAKAEATRPAHVEPVRAQRADCTRPRARSRGSARERFPMRGRSRRRRHPSPARTRQHCRARSPPVAAARRRGSSISSCRPTRCSACRWKPSVTSERARVEDEVVARVTRDVRVGDRVAIPAGREGARRGHAGRARRQGARQGAARHPLHIGRARRRDARAARDRDDLSRRRRPGGESAAKIGGGAIGGAILGGIFGGAKGAVHRRHRGCAAPAPRLSWPAGAMPRRLPSGTPVTVRLVKPAR